MLYLVAGMTVSMPMRVVYVGKSGWAYDRYVGLLAFATRAAADEAAKNYGRGGSDVFDELFNGIFEAMDHVPLLKWVKVIELQRRESLPPVSELFLIKAMGPADVVVWFGRDVRDPAMEPKGLLGFRSRAIAVEVQDELRVRAKAGWTFKVMTLVRKTKVGV